MGSLFRQKKLTLTGHDKLINDVKFSLDGKHLATVSDDSTASIWNVTFLPYLPMREEDNSSIDANFVWDTTSQYYLKTITDTSPIYGVNFNYPTGKYLISSNRNGEVKVWDIKSGQELRRFAEIGPTDPTNPNWAYRVDFSPDGARIAAAGRDGRARVWFLFGGDVLAFSSHTDRVRDVAFSLMVSDLPQPVGMEPEKCGMLYPANYCSH
ncbi:MAG: hypothetical protein HC875_35180 [Anaerolineales bacterium]|nr:hypothetical protein [Anaerolineales bacterium]